MWAITLCVLGVWVWGCACVGVCVQVTVSARVFVFQYLSFLPSFVWLSMSSNLLLCYWFLCEYVCIPCFCLIKWQSALSRWTRIINSILLLISVRHEASLSSSRSVSSGSPQDTVLSPILFTLYRYKWLHRHWQNTNHKILWPSRNRRSFQLRFSQFILLKLKVSVTGAGIIPWTWM